MKRIIEKVVKLEQLVPGGQAIGDLADGRKVFVWGALPGETALIRLTKLKKTHAEAIVTEIIEPSPDRIVPRRLFPGYLALADHDRICRKPA